MNRAELRRMAESGELAYGESAPQQFILAILDALENLYMVADEVSRRAEVERDLKERLHRALDDVRRLDA